MADTGEMVPLIIAASFLIFYPLMVSMASPIMVNEWAADLQPQDYLKDKFDPAWLAQNRVYENATGVTLVNLTAGMYGSYSDADWTDLGGLHLGGEINSDATDIKLEDSDTGRAVHIIFIKDNDRYSEDSEHDDYKYLDYVVIYRLGSYSSIEKEYVPFSLILSEFAIQNQASLNSPTDYRECVISVDLFSKMSIHFVAYPGFDFQDSLESGSNFAVYASQSVIEATTGSGDAWNVIANLMTFNFTGTGFSMLDVFISTPMWIAIIYVAYKLILAAIPFVGG